MMLFKAGAVIGRSRGFRLEKEEDQQGIEGCEAGRGAKTRRYFFVNTGGYQVATDALGASIWGALPGSVADIRERISGQADLSERMLQEFLYVMVRAQIAVEINGSEPRDWSSPSGLCPGSLSVVIVTLNGEAHIRDCLASLRAQTCGPLDIHIVDNGSTDATIEIARREFPEVKIHPLTKNLFYPGGVNYGLEHTTGSSVLVLNDDVELEPECVAEMVRILEASPRAAAVVPMMKLFHLRGFINGIGNHVRVKGWGSDNFVGYVDIGQFEMLTEVPSACVSAALLRRAAIEAVGPFDAAYRAYYEDADWSFRARLAGWTITAAPRAIVYHKFSAFWKNMERKLKLAVRNRLRFVLKNFDGSLRFAFLRSYVKEDLVNVLSLGRKKKFAEARAYVRAYLSLLGTLPDILVKRAKAKKARSKARLENGIAAILKLNPVQWTGMNKENVPRLDAGIYFGYYAFQFSKRRSSGDAGNGKEGAAANNPEGESADKKIEVSARSGEK